MVSNGPASQGLNPTHMFSFVDYRGEKCEKIRDGTIMAFLNNGKFSKFRAIVQKALAVGELNTVSFKNERTLFVVSDNYLSHIPGEFFTNMDTNTARGILNASTIPRLLDSKILLSSPVSYYNTKGPRMYMTNINRITSVNECATVIEFDYFLSNGIVHLVDNIILPTTNTYIN